MQIPRKKRRRKPLSEIDWSNPSQRDTLRAAQAYVESGLSLLPISGDGSKMPAFELLISESELDESQRQKLDSLYERLDRFNRERQLSEE